MKSVCPKCGGIPPGLFGSTEAPSPESADANFKQPSGAIKAVDGRIKNGIIRVGDDDVEWITVNGTAIPIKNGELSGTVGEKIKKSGKSNEKVLKGGGKLKDNPDISSTGVNEFKSGFSERNLDRHWVGGESDHSKEYKNYTKEQYASEALDLVQSTTNSTIEGHKNKNGQVIRYDKKNNNYVKGHPDVGIATMFKPKDGIEYYNKVKKYETGEDN